MACIPWKPRALCPPVPGALGSEHAARSQKRRMLGREGGSSLPRGCPSQGGGGNRVLQSSTQHYRGARRGQSLHLPFF